jgi:hypothetical protein
MGFLVIEAWDHEIFNTPWVVIEKIREARGTLGKGSTRRDRHFQ